MYLCHFFCSVKKNYKIFFQQYPIINMYNSGSLYAVNIFPECIRQFYRQL